MKMGISEAFGEVVQGVLGNFSEADEVRVQVVNGRGTQMQSALLQAPCTVTIETSKRKVTISIGADGKLKKVRKNEK